jgi:hypothetical protein
MQQSSLLGPLVSYEGKEVCENGPREYFIEIWFEGMYASLPATIQSFLCIFDDLHVFQHSGARGQCYKTFFVRDLWIFVLS